MCSYPEVESSEQLLPQIESIHTCSDSFHIQLAIEDEIEKIVKNQSIGETKKGDLRGFQVHKI
jgi:hypothetical protein